MKFKKSTALGILIAISSFIAYINLEIGLLITLALIALALNVPKPKILFTTIFCNSIIGFTFLSLIFKSGDDLIIVLPLVFSIILICSSFLFRIKTSVISSYENIFSIILVFECLINLYSIIMLEDPFGRVMDMRTDGLNRSLGLLGHPFLSVSVCAVGYIIARHKKNRLILIIAIVAFISNQTLRSYSTLLILFFFDFISNTIIKRKLRFFIYTISSIIFSSTIYLLVIFSESISNQLRSLVWINSIDEILKSPWTGNNGFKVFEKEKGVSVENLINSGITENVYLDIALHFGIPLAFAFMLLLTINIYKNVMANSSHNSLKRKNEVLASILFVDSFYGNLLTVSFFIVYVFISNLGRNYDQTVFFKYTRSSLN